VEVGDVALQHSDDEDPIDTTCCEVCGLPHDEATLLLCDGCDRGLVSLVVHISRFMTES